MTEKSVFSFVLQNFLHYAFLAVHHLVWTNEGKEDVNRCVNDSEDCSSLHLIESYLIDKIHILQFSCFDNKREKTLDIILIVWYIYQKSIFMEQYYWFEYELHNHKSIIFQNIWLCFIIYTSYLKRDKEKYLITYVFLKTTKGSICVTISVCNTLCKHRRDQRRNVFSLLLTITNYIL